jgi:spermidine/putrescine transport system ATP-binding protein
MLRVSSEVGGYAQTLVSSMGMSTDVKQDSREGPERAKGQDDYILRAVDLVHQYGPVTALDHVSLDVRRGEFLTILGESGSGKTTMLRVISGLEKVSHAAQLTLDGREAELYDRVPELCALSTHVGRGKRLLRLETARRGQG